MSGGKHGGQTAAGGPSICASQPALPSVSSAQPLRRSASLTSAQKHSAAACWQATLQDRLGSPGPPPPREALPSLYEQRGRGSKEAASFRPVSGASRSAPPSTVGPSASVVAWFAQFQCNKCGRIPTALDAKFCFSCGEALPLPRVPAAVTGGPRSRLAENLGEVAAAAAMEATAGAQGSGSGSRVGMDPGRGPRQGQRQPTPQQQQLAEASQPRAQPQHVQHAQHAQLAQAKAQIQKRRGYRGDAVKPRPPRLPGQRAASECQQKDLPWGTRESQVAVWLGNIKPRRHD
eukprot:TRINITY_DN105734_c0_g1_i1.p1 TRINITY_DN105734_c0_g1~~TRINITY_DN105734_c0_g1_i1.p1  ORF type:complete len:303 (-),score=54.08 TRINITY_DN105734_c0_g1_i1:67-936(-)